MNTVHWRTISWFVCAAGILCVLVFVIELITVRDCTGACATKSGGYRVGYRIGKAIANGEFLAAMLLFFIVGSVWLLSRKG